jgi:hypothetical protein
MDRRRHPRLEGAWWEEAVRHVSKVGFEDRIAVEADAGAELAMFARGSLPQQGLVRGQRKRLT